MILLFIPKTVHFSKLILFDVTLSIMDCLMVNLFTLEDLLWAQFDSLQLGYLLNQTRNGMHIRD
jgi:hypothetical protein